MNSSERTDSEEKKSCILCQDSVIRKVLVEALRDKRLSKKNRLNKDEIRVKARLRRKERGG